MALPPKQSRFVKIMMWFMYLNPSTRIMISFFFMMMITMLIFSTMAYLDTWKFSYSFLPIAITTSAIIAIYSEWDMRKIRLIDEQTQKIIEQGLKTVVTVQISIGDSEYDEMFTYYLSVPNKLGKNWIFKLDIHASQGSQLAEGEYSAEIYFSQGVESPTLIFIEQHVILLGSPETKGIPPRRSTAQAEGVAIVIIGASFIISGLVLIADIAEHSGNDLVFLLFSLLFSLLLSLSLES